MSSASPVHAAYNNFPSGVQLRSLGTQEEADVSETMGCSSLVLFADKMEKE
jgi:hypothetical protein